VLITAGPTFEPIDTVRGITNTSSGKMGYAVARAARDAGAAVTLVSGPTALAPPRGLERIDVSSAQQMYDAVIGRAAKIDVFIGVAAVADYRPKEARKHKLKKGSGEMTLELKPNPDILGTLAARRNAPFCVGFAAETENLDAYADAKRRRKKVPLLAANLAQHAFGADDNQLILFDDAGRHELPRASKVALARALVAHIAKLLPKK
jgi:phosphopantothenoylcysteine decarboxylase/phosphopantothenate--cysteine ligase